jgi:hypothetical protein
LKQYQKECKDCVAEKAGDKNRRKRFLLHRAEERTREIKRKSRNPALREKGKTGGGAVGAPPKQLRERKETAELYYTVLCLA